jgi:hypothetical protein
MSSCADLLGEPSGPGERRDMTSLLLRVVRLRDDAADQPHVLVVEDVA